MSNMKNFLNSEMPAMILSAIMEATEEAAEKAKKEKAQFDAKTMANADTEAKSIDSIKEQVKKAAKLIGEEACKVSDEYAAGLFYTYSSFMTAGFSAAQAFELTRCTLIG